MKQAYAERRHAPFAMQRQRFEVPRAGDPLRELHFTAEMNPRVGALLVCVFALGCSSKAPMPPRNVGFGGGGIAVHPIAAANNAPPKILAIRFSADTVTRGQTWTGAIVTTTNVASVEVRTNLFSIDVPRTGYGRFAFALNVLDVPPIFIRAYRLRVIARNAAGQAVEEDLPFRIQ